MTSPFKQVADELYEQGLSVIPYRPNSKIPAINNWSDYSKRLPTKKEIKSWKKEFPKANVGIVMGEASGVVGIDLDYDIDGYHKKIQKLLGDSMSHIPAKEGHKGCTLFYKYNDEDSASWSVEGERVLDFLSNKRHTVMPPSIHPEGDIYRYQGLIDFDDNIPKLPKKFIKKVNKLFGKKSKKNKNINEDTEVNIIDLAEALEHIESDCYDTWTKVGMALRSSLDGDGFEIWDKWSQKSDKYDGAESTFKKWESFRGRGINISTVYWLATKNGFEFSREEATLDGIVRPSDLAEELEDWRENGIDRGETTGLENLDSLIHTKKGEFTVWTGYAGQGKSEMIDSIALRLMEKDWKFLYCSLEKMPKSHAQSLIHKITGKPIEERSKKEQRRAIRFLNEHCAMIGRKDFNPTIDNIYQMAKIYKNLYGLDALVIDPFNYITSPIKGNIFEHAGYVLETCTRMAQTLDISVHMVAHPKKPDKTFGKRLPEITIYSVSGSADFANMADMLVAVYRTVDDTTRIEVLKVRDQDVDRTGKCEFLFDKYTKRHEPYDSFDDL